MKLKQTCYFFSLKFLLQISVKSTVDLVIALDIRDQFYTGLNGPIPRVFVQRSKAQMRTVINSDMCHNQK